MSTTTIISTPIGNLKLCATKDALTHCLWTQEKPQVEDKTPLLQEAAHQLHAYFEKKLCLFDLPIKLAGTTFQKRVWEALLRIPYGRTCSYKALALSIEHQNAVRAVGNANGKNPLCVIIPCHRVIYASGRIGGYSAGLGYKEKLLAMEKSYDPNHNKAAP